MAPPPRSGRRRQVRPSHRKALGMEEEEEGAKKRAKRSHSEETSEDDTKTRAVTSPHHPETLAASSEEEEDDNGSESSTNEKKAEPKKSASTSVKRTTRVKPAPRVNKRTSTALATPPQTPHNLAETLQGLRSHCSKDLLDRLGPLDRFRHFAPSHTELHACRNKRGVEAALTFYDRLNELVDYYQEYGNFQVPQKHGRLGIWVNKIRQHKKVLDDGQPTNLLNPYRIAWLEQLDFDWGDTRGDTKWYTRFQDLQAFQKEMGHCDVPTKAHALGRWVSQQRKEYKLWRLQQPSVMTQERVQLLEQIGFRWDMYCPVSALKSKTKMIVF